MFESIINIHTLIPYQIENWVFMFKFDTCLDQKKPRELYLALLGCVIVPEGVGVVRTWGLIFPSFISVLQLSILYSGDFVHDTVLPLVQRLEDKHFKVRPD